MKKMVGMFAMMLLMSSSVYANQNEDISGIRLEENVIEWGAGKEALLELLGEPDEINESGKDEILVYEDVDTEYAKKARVELTVGKENIIAPDTEEASSGLYFAKISTKEVEPGDIEEQIKTIYGNETSIEVNEKMQNEALKVPEEGYYYKECTNESWQIKNMEISDEELIEYINENINQFKADEETQLFNISLLGVDNDEDKTCVIQIDASKYILYGIFVESK